MWHRIEEEGKQLCWLLEVEVVLLVEVLRSSLVDIGTVEACCWHAKHHLMFEEC